MSTNNDDLVNILHKGFRVTLGATASVLESIQDPVKRRENLQKLSSDPQQLTVLADELAEKGEVTEREARNLVDAILAQKRGNNTSDASYNYPNTSRVVIDSDLQREIEELTSQVIGLKDDLQKLQDN
jgi:polyhydroxyalkanoate synthesis regulator phasin